MGTYNLTGLPMMDDQSDVLPASMKSCTLKRASKKVSVVECKWGAGSNACFKPLTKKGRLQ